jgi:hypothetical protein
MENNTNESIDSCPNRPNFEYYCQRCGKAIKYKKGYKIDVYTHEQHLKDCWPNGVNAIDYIECKLCKFAGHKIVQHVKIVHKLSKEDYLKQHGEVTSSNFRKTFSDLNKVNGDWISRRKQQGDDLKEYRQKMGKAVSDSILSNPKERLRRSNLIGNLNKSTEARKRASDTAKITSARPEIQQQRSERLAKWRKEHPDDFFEKCIKNYAGSYKSKPEINLFNFLKLLKSHNFKHNQFLTFKHITTDQKVEKICKQIDIADHIKHIYVEFDGILHFEPRLGIETLNGIRQKDKLLNDYISNSNHSTLIRVSYDCYRKNKFTLKSLKQIIKLLKNPQQGVHFVGTLYNENKVSS